jgi:hypothetical protein
VKEGEGRDTAARTKHTAEAAEGSSSSWRSRAIDCGHRMLIPASSLLYSHDRYWSPDCYGGAVVYHQPNLGGTKATARYFVCDVFDAQVNNKMLLLMLQQCRVLLFARHTVSLDAARHCVYLIRLRRHCLTAALVARWRAFLTRPLLQQAICAAILRSGAEC